MKLFASMALVGISLLFTISAAAQDATKVCPDNAVISLLNVRGAVQKGELKDIKQVYNTAEAGLTRCVDNPNAQAATASLFVMIGEALPRENIEDRYTVFDKAYQAFENHEKHFDRDKTPLEIPVDGQEPFKFYSFNDVSGSLKSTIGALAELEMRGKPHRAFDLATCPYQHNAHIYTETEGYRLWMNRHAASYKKSDNPKRDIKILAIQRLEGLWEYCETFRKNPYLSYTLADYYLETGQALKDTDPKRALAHAQKAKFYGDKHGRSERGDRWAWPNVTNNGDQVTELIRSLQAE